jgi:cytidyltransferase-like protein
VYAAELKDLDTEQYRWTVDFRVSKGSYIRALARDIGQAAGTVAHLSALRRTTSGAFRVQNAHRIETIEQACVTDPLAVADYFTCAGVPSFEPQGRRVSADNDSALPESCLYRLQPEDFDSREGLRIVSRPRLAEAAVALGTFDGVHEGHRALLQAAVAEAQGRGLLSVAVTFDPLPAAVIRPASAPAYLMTVDERCAAIRNCGIDEVIVVDFTPAFAQREAAWFVEQFLPTVVRPRVLLAGRNFRLGRGGECDVAGLDVLAQKNGMDFIVHDLIKDDTGEVISSTRLRAAVLGK